MILLSTVLHFAAFFIPQNICVVFVCIDKFLVNLWLIGVGNTTSKW